MFLNEQDGWLPSGEDFHIPLVILKTLLRRPPLTIIQMNIKITQISAEAPLASVWYLVDVGQVGSSNTWAEPSGINYQPAQPVHGGVRNYSYLTVMSAPEK